MGLVIYLHEWLMFMVNVYRYINIQYMDGMVWLLFLFWFLGVKCPLFSIQAKLLTFSYQKKSHGYS